jgi:hypothetical protein
MTDDDNSGVVVKLDDIEGRRLPSRKYCPECGPDADVFIKRGSRRRFEAHCCGCDYPIFVLKPHEVLSVVRWLRERHGRVHRSGGGAAA